MRVWTEKTSISGARMPAEHLPTFERPTTTERVFNRLFGWLVGMGLGLRHNFVLQVRGRKTGQMYSTPVDVLDYGGKRFLVAARGQTQWVRNAVASGRVILKKGRAEAEFTLRSIGDEEKPALLKAYLDRFKPTVQRYFPIPAGVPVEQFAPLASRYPVFELIPVALASK
jgi:deazaflavin-dependent oxidoreductase (nitroreductase family)